jgi:hypothetical protein
MAVVEVFTAAGRDPNIEPFPADYFRVTDVLVDIEAEIRRSLLAQAEAQAEEHGSPVEPLVHLVSSWSPCPEPARRRGSRPDCLADRDNQILHRHAISTSERTVAMITRQLLTPLSLH